MSAVLGTDLLDSNEDELQAQAGGVVIRRVGGFSMSEWARMETAERRRKKQAEARARYRERRAFFTRATDRQQV
jgi:hypothetical protein